MPVHAVQHLDRHAEKAGRLPLVDPALHQPAMIKERADGLIVFPSPILFGQYPRIVALAANNRLPAIYAAREGRRAWRSGFLRSKLR
jgi:hypothetical protein